jgi:hypothetical protein
MNLYTGLLFLHGHLVDLAPFAEQPEYGPSYGNKVANDRVLRERWANERRAHHVDAGREDDLDGTPKAA